MPFSTITLKSLWCYPKPVLAQSQSTRNTPLFSLSDPASQCRDVSRHHYGKPSCPSRTACSEPSQLSCVGRGCLSKADKNPNTRQVFLLIYLDSSKYLKNTLTICLSRPQYQSITPLQKHRVMKDIYVYTRYIGKYHWSLLSYIRSLFQNTNWI